MVVLRARMTDWGAPGRSTRYMVAVPMDGSTTDRPLADGPPFQRPKTASALLATSSMLTSPTTIKLALAGV